MHPERMRARLLVTALSAALLAGACREPNAPWPKDAGEAATSATASKPHPAQIQAQAAAAEQATAPATATAEATSIAASGKPLCNIEFVDNIAFGPTDVEVKGAFQLRGWLGDDNGAPVVAPVLVLAAEDGRSVQLPLTLAVARPDVVAAYPNRPALATSGFVYSMDTAQLVAPRTHVYLAYSVGAKQVTCDNARHLRIAAPGQ